ncbi:hypothetical protein [Levilactobacillus bambusae]|uniref:Pectate lyase superfamily protein domain-containing protein n=1 Tax=Levilactobacillus bambusae TaxID=2024736 RepID=A0A2V1N0A7_9LACO|nr:hypothetical protein [Levilactobacillus bambusae]PWF99779.1 hypothetical protein DCM90_06880 [Levilactobacillus bambusae]
MFFSKKKYFYLGVVLFILIVLIVSFKFSGKGIKQNYLDTTLEITSKQEMKLSSSDRQKIKGRENKYNKTLKNYHLAKRINVKNNHVWLMKYAQKGHANKYIYWVDTNEPTEIHMTNKENKLINLWVRPQPQIISDNQKINISPQVIKVNFRHGFEEDSSATLKKLINSIDPNRPTTILFNKGTYILSNKIFLHSNLSLKGLSRNETILGVKVGSQPLNFIFPSAVNGKNGGIKNITFSKLRLVGAIGMNRNQSDFRVVQASQLPKSLGNNESAVHLQANHADVQNRIIGMAFNKINLSSTTTYTIRVKYLIPRNSAATQSLIIQHGNGRNDPWINKKFSIQNDGNWHTAKWKIRGTNDTNIYVGLNGLLNRNIEGYIGEVSIKDAAGSEVMPSGGKIQSNSNFYPWYNGANGPASASISLSVLHAQNVKLYDLTCSMVQPINGHFIDIDGSQNVALNHILFLGNNPVGRLGDLNKELIQVDYAMKWALSYQWSPNEIDQNVYDNLASNNISVSNSQFKPIYNSHHEIYGFSGLPIGEHTINDQQLIHDVKFMNNVIVDPIPQNNIGVWNYSNNSIIHFEGINNLKIKNNIFRQSNSDESVTSQHWISVFKPSTSLTSDFKNIVISNNKFINTASKSSLIDVNDNELMNHTKLGAPLLTNGKIIDNELDLNKSMDAYNILSRIDKDQWKFINNDRKNKMITRKNFIKVTALIQIQKPNGVVAKQYGADTYFVTDLNDLVDQAIKRLPTKVQTKIKSEGKMHISTNQDGIQIIFTSSK